MSATPESPPRQQVYGTPPLKISEELIKRLIEEYTADDVADILRAIQGVPEPERPRVTITESPWPWVAFWLAVGAIGTAYVLCTHQLPL